MLACFIEYSTSYGFSRELANTAITNIGGFKKLSYWATSIISGGVRSDVNGYGNQDQAVAFFEENETAIKEWIRASHAEFDDVSLIPEYVANMDMVSKHDFSVADIEAFMVATDTDQELYADIAHAITSQLIYDLSQCYNRWYTSLMGG